MSWKPYIKPQAACGTDSGYYRHRHLCEPACEPCRQAHCEAQKRRYARSPESYRAARRDRYYRHKNAA